MFPRLGQSTPHFRLKLESMVFPFQYGFGLERLDLPFLSRCGISFSKLKCLIKVQNRHEQQREAR